MNTIPSKSRARGGSAAHLKLEKPRFLFLEGSAGAAVAPTCATMALAGASAVLAGSSAGTLEAGASTPAMGANSTVASAARGDGGGGLHLSGRTRSPSLSSSSSDDDPAGVPEGGALAARAAGTPHCVAPGAPAAGSPLLRARRPLLFPSLRGMGSRPGAGLKD
jgi:hypothetical protein